MMQFGLLSLPKKLGLTTPPVLVVVAFVLSVFGMGTGVVFYPFLLVSAIGVCILVVSAVVAWVSAKSFLMTGSLNLLLLGLAVSVFGTMSILGGLVGQIDSAAGSLVYFLGLFTAGSLHLFSAVLTYVGSPLRKSKLRLRAGVAYSAAVLFMIVFSAVAIESSIPQISNTATKIAAASTAALFFMAAFVFSRVYSRSQSSTLFWYSMALATTGFAFTALIFSQNTGDLGTWTGIIGVLLGTFYFLISVVVTPKTPDSRGSGLGD